MPDSPETTYYRAGWEAATEQITSSLAIPGESTEDTARRIRVELTTLRSALREAHEQRDLATEAASKARDGEEAAKEFAELARVELLSLDWLRTELRALEWLALHGYPLGRGDDGRVMAVYREEDGEPDWNTSWTEAAKAFGWKP